jgi:tetratricopeptide (TPR) repeat protein
MSHSISIEEAQNNLLSCAAYLSEGIRSADGHSEALKAIVPHYVERGDVDLAATLADTVDDPFVRDRLLMLVAEKCAAIDDDEYAFQLSDAIEEFGMREAARERIVLQKSLKGEFEKALEIADGLTHKSDALAIIAVNQAAQSQEEEALRTVEQIDFPNAKVSALQNLAAINLQKSADAKAAELLERAKDAANEIEHAEEKIRAFIEIANSFIEAGRKDKAVETFDKAKNLSENLDNVHRDAFLSNVSQGFLRSGSLDLADRALDLIADKTQISSTLAGFAREFWQKGEKDEAVEALEEAYAILKSQRERETRDSRARYALFAAIAVEFARFSKPERAIEIAQTNDDETQSNAALAQIAQVCAAQENGEWTQQAIQAINDDASRMLALINVSDVKYRLEKKEEAVQILNEAAQLAETVPQFSVRSSAYNDLAKRFIEYGDTERAREISRENLEIITQIRDESSRAVALANLEQLYKQAGFSLTDHEKQILLSLIRSSEW